MKIVFVKAGLVKRCRGLRTLLGNSDSVSSNAQKIIGLVGIQVFDMREPPVYGIFDPVVGSFRIKKNIVVAIQYAVASIFNPKCILFQIIGRGAGIGLR